MYDTKIKLGVEMTKDLKPMFLWAKANGDANIYDRILVKVIPALLRENIHLSAHLIEEAEMVSVSNELYEVVVAKTEELLNMQYEGGKNV